MLVSCTDCDIGLGEVFPEDFPDVVELVAGRLSSLEAFRLTVDLTDEGVSERLELPGVVSLVPVGSLASSLLTPVTCTLAGLALRTYEVLGRICTCEWVDDVIIELLIEDGGRDASTERIPAQTQLNY